MKKISALWLILVLAFTLAACSGNTLASRSVTSAPQSAVGVEAKPEATVDTEQNSEISLSPPVVEYDKADLDSSAASAEVSYIRLEGDSITLNGSGATVEGNTITITSAGKYSISGTLNDGQIIVNAEDKDKVTLILNGANIASSSSAPIYVINAGKTVITLADGAENFITDGNSYILEEAESDEPNAAIFSNDDLTLNGNGALTVKANYNNGLASKDDLKVTGGSLTVTAVNDGLKGKDSIAVKDGMITINAGGEGMQSTNNEDANKGYISIEGGRLNIIAGQDGIQAETRVMVSGGDISLTTGGGSVNSSSAKGWGFWGKNDDADTASAKGLKAGVDVTLTGGVIAIDSSDDAIQSNNSLTIDGGTITLASGDDGIHSDAKLEINGGELNITKAYEGLESAVITLNDGNIHLIADDDGINVAGGKDGSSMNGRPGQNEFTASGDYHLTINGGYIFVNAAGDGLDSNGSIDMTSGVVIVNGPTNNGNGPLDYNGAFNITGGYIVAAGSSGMAQAPSPSSTQYSVMYNFTSVQAAGTTVHIETAAGEEVLTFVPAKKYQSVLLSSPELKNGSTYVVYTGGSSTGTATDGLYADGTYTTGTEVASLTISSLVTRGGATRGDPGRVGPGGGPPPADRP